MTLWRNLVVALVAAFALAACSSSDSGPSQAELDAANAAKAAAEAEAAAAKQAAEEAAAAAARAAEEARQQVIAEQEKQAVMDAVAAAMASVDALMDDSSDADVAGAAADIAAATAAIAAAATLSEADMAMYNAQVAEIQADLTLAEANIRAYRAEMAAEEANQQATAAERAKMAVDAATTALNTATGAQGMSQTAYEAAVAAQAAAQSAVANANSETLADASAALAEALIASAAAAADLAVKTQAVADATTALEMAAATLAEVDPDHVALQAARDALAEADTAAIAQAAKIKALEDEIARLKQAEADRQQAARDEAEKERMMAMAASGKALLAALTDNPLAFLDATTAHAFTAGGELNLNEASTVTGENVPPDMEAAGSAGLLGGWKGTNYADTNAGTKVVNSAVVYTNQAEPKRMAFTAANSGLTEGTGAAAGTFTIGNAADPKIGGSEFSTAGTKTHGSSDTTDDEVSFSGTYDGASGNYSCEGTCTSQYSSDGLTLAGGTWIFTPSQGAMIATPDGHYLFFGWWLQTDEDGPTYASAFTGTVGTAPALVDVSAATFQGSATYSGEAAGKFALSNPLDGTGDAGHFTADVTLTAKFGPIAAPNNGGISGTLDNFMANGESEPWSVALHLAPWGTTGAFATPTTDDTTTTDVDETKGTTWSIDGNSASRSGSWTGQMYDDATSAETTGADDGSDVPTTVIGTFQSSFSSIGQMVGGFGAEKQ